MKIYQKKDEWVGTQIVWQIEESSTGSKIKFMHKGLVPMLDCYEVCKGGWGYFLGSLKNYLETGMGTPYIE